MISCTFPRSWHESGKSVDVRRSVFGSLKRLSDTGLVKRIAICIGLMLALQSFPPQAHASEKELAEQLAQLVKASEDAEGDGDRVIEVFSEIDELLSKSPDSQEFADWFGDGIFLRGFDNPVSAFDMRIQGGLIDNKERDLLMFEKSVLFEWFMAQPFNTLDLLDGCLAKEAQIAQIDPVLNRKQHNIYVALDMVSKVMRVPHDRRAALLSGRANPNFGEKDEFYYDALDADILGYLIMQPVHGGDIGQVEFVDVQTGVTSDAKYVEVRAKELSAEYTKEIDATKWLVSEFLIEALHDDPGNARKHLCSGTS